MRRFCATMPSQLRRTRPCVMICPTTHLAVSMGTAKLMPCAPKIIAVLTPMTRARVSTSGPPELPGLSATSDWMMFSISRPSCARMLRPSADTTPADTVDEKPSGLPMATHSCPTRSLADSPNCACGSPVPSMRMTAVSVAGSTPHTLRRVRRAVGERDLDRRPPPRTTCALVRM